MENPGSLKMRKILVKAPVLSRSGYGEQSRFALRALKSRPDLYDIYVYPIGWGKTGWIHEDSEEKQWIDAAIKKTAEYQSGGGNYDASLQITIPNEWEKIAPVNIGYTAGIETTRVSPAWIEKSENVDRIIVVSNHSKIVYQQTSYTVTNNQTREMVEGDFRCVKPIDVVNYPVRKYEPKSVDLKLDYDFNFLVVSQWGPRKNLENTIGWFLEEFKNDEVGLVLKVNIMNNSTMDMHESTKRLNKILTVHKNRKCKIYLLHGDMSEQEMTGLYVHPQIKALINLSHGEGYGLPMFEAAYNELPIVTTGWSGQVDFLYAPKRDKKKKVNIVRPHFASVDYLLALVQKEAVWDGVIEKESAWCYPEKDSYKQNIRNVYKQYGKYKRLAASLKKHIEKNFSAEKIYADFTSSVESCFKEEQQEGVELMVF